MNIQEFMALVLSDKTPTQHKLSLGKLSTEEVEQIKEQTGFDLTDYEHFLENFGIKHTINQHGNAKKEALRGQIGITIDDFEKIKDILENPDAISHVGKNKAGRDLILYHKELITQTLYKREKSKK